MTTSQSSYQQAEPRYHHGNSPAAWTMVGIVIAGCVVAAAAFPLIAPWLFAVGCGIVVLGLVVGKVMQMAGYGELPSYRTEEPATSAAEGPTKPDADPQS
jgi:hypothetical protein